MKMLIEQKTPQNVVEHTLVVNKIAVFLAKKLKEAGVNINVELVDTASLLHDMTKPGEDHARDAEKILKEKGFPEIAEVVGFHDFKGVIEETSNFEAKLLQYADKRCGKVNIVSLDKRYKSWEKKYGSSEKLARGKEIMKSIENEIFAKLKIKPEDLKNLVK